MSTPTDRELLELAAKAAGIEGSYVFSAGGKSGSGFPYDRQGIRRTGGTWWNPLNDDGDAFRLAIKVGLCITIADGQMLAHRYYSHTQGLNGATEPVSGKADNERVAAFRRAIVRAAAEIGKAGA